MAITYKSQGAGVVTEASGGALSPLCPATVDAGDILIAHVWYEGTTTTPATPSGWDLLSGPHTVETSIARHWIFGRIADGSEDGAAVAFGTPAVTTMRAGRVYSFAGRVSGTITQLVRGFAHLSHATDPQMPTVTTTRTGSLAVACVGQADDNAQASATGESGGNWVEAVAEFVSSATTPDVGLGIQTSDMASPATISGGSISTTDDPCGVIAFEIRNDIRLFGSSTLTLTDGITTSGKLNARGSSSLTESVGITTAGKLNARGESSMAESVGITSGGFVSAFSTSSATFAAAISTAGTLGAFGSSSLTETATITSDGYTTWVGATVTPSYYAGFGYAGGPYAGGLASGASEHFGSSSLELTAAITSAGTRATFSSSTATYVVAITTAGTLTAFGSSALTETVGITTLGRLTAFASSSLTETVTITTSGRLNAYGASSLTETVSIVTQGARTTYGASALSLTVAITTAGNRTTFGSSALTESVAIGSNGVRQTFAASSLIEVIGIVTSGFVGVPGRPPRNATSASPAGTRTRTSVRSSETGITPGRP